MGFCFIKWAIFPSGSSFSFYGALFFSMGFLLILWGVFFFTHREHPSAVGFLYGCTGVIFILGICFFFSLWVLSPWVYSIYHGHVL
jgi:hypothetical protein